MWWLISSEDAEKIRQALAAPEHEENAYNCGGQQGRQPCSACEGVEKRDKAYYLVDTGLHVTDCVPFDYKSDISSRKRIREFITCILQRCDLKAHRKYSW